MTGFAVLLRSGWLFAQSRNARKIRKLRALGRKHGGAGEVAGKCHSRCTCVRKRLASSCFVLFCCCLVLFYFVASTSVFLLARQCLISVPSHPPPVPASVPLCSSPIARALRTRRSRVPSLVSSPILLCVRELFRRCPVQSFSLALYAQESLVLF